LPGCLQGWCFDAKRSFETAPTPDSVFKTMIHYNVWFSFRADANEPMELAKLRRLMDDFKARGMLSDYRLLKNRGEERATKLPAFQVIIEFCDNDQFGLPFAEVEALGVRSGMHGAMIEHVEDFVVEVFEQL
jgi:hypothetical protein